jgi:hypothetical protein
VPKACRVHQVKADSGLQNESGADDKKVLKENVHCVFLARQTDLQKTKAQVHEKHKRRTNHHPKVIDCEC